MIETKQSDDIRDFLKFYIQMVGPGDAVKRKGASEAEIAEFAALAQFPLPPLYVGYLREFGGEDPVLKMAGDGSPDVQSLISLYRDEAGKPDSEIPAGGVVIGSQSGLMGQRTLMYSEAAKRGLEDPYVAVTWWGEFYGEIQADSFRNYLYGKAFSLGCWEKGPSFIVQHKDDALFSTVDQALIGLGFSPFWFSDRWKRRFEREDGSTVTLERDRDGIGVYATCPDQAISKALRSALVGLGLRESVGYQQMKSRQQTSL